MLDELHKKLDFLTIGSAVIFLRHLGHFEEDVLTIPSSSGYVNVRAKDIVVYEDRDLPARALAPVLFFGGPHSEKKYCGSYLTFLVDRAMFVMTERGYHNVEAIIEYCKGFVYV